MADTVVKMKEAIPPDYRVPKEKLEEAKRKLEEANVRYVMASWVDVNGRPKGKFVPVERFEELAHGSEKYTPQAFEVMGPLGPHDDDQAALPDLDSLLICPWDRQYAWMASDLWWHGEPFPYCSRTILKRNVARLKEHGLAMMLGMEPEFYILREGSDGRPRPYHPDDFGPCWGYDIDSTLDAAPVINVIERYISELGWDVGSFDHEAGHSQYEFDFGFTDVVSMCDRFTFLRLMVKQVAKAHGVFATFMPKPFPDDFRSGAHHNMSLVDAKSGKNLMTSDKDPRGIGLSEMAYDFIGGLLKHANTITAVACPTVNGYKGFVSAGIGAEGIRDWTWAPTYAAYGDNNRALMLRIPGGRQCIENRVPDSSTNPYWSAAMHMGAGLDGILNHIDPGSPLNENVYESSPASLRERGVPLLPSTLSDALDAFEKDPIAGEVLGEGPKKEYLDLKRQEWGRFNRHVSQWEIDHYLKFF